MSSSNMLLPNGTSNFAISTRLEPTPTSWHYPWMTAAQMRWSRPCRCGMVKEVAAPFTMKHSNRNERQVRGDRRGQQVNMEDRENVELQRSVMKACAEEAQISEQAGEGRRFLLVHSPGGHSR